jgi:hypothetical protein
MSQNPSGRAQETGPRVPRLYAPPLVRRWTLALHRPGVKERTQPFDLCPFLFIELCGSFLSPPVLPCHVCSVAYGVG